MSGTGSPSRRPPDVVRDQLENLNDLLKEVGREKAPAIHKFWKGVRGALQAQTDEIRQLREAQQTLARDTQSVVPAVRPDTSHSVNQLRLALDDQFDRLVQEADEASNTVEAIIALPQQWVQNYLSQRRSHSHPSELGCWVSGNRPGHENGYVKLNLRNTTYPAGSARSGLIGVQPWEHQMTIVGKGEGERLRLATKRTATGRSDYEVSLCPLIVIRLLAHIE